jgi:hypothetical protein
MKAPRLPATDAAQKVRTPETQSAQQTAPTTAPEATQQPAKTTRAQRKGVGFEAAKGLPVPKSEGRFIPRQQGAGLGGIANAMQKKVGPEAKLATIGVVMSKISAENPAADLFHHFRAGQSYVFAQGPQTERVHFAACKAANSFADSPSAGPVRVVTWSSANGWSEVSPDTGLPKTDKEGRIAYNDKALLEELYGPQQQGVVLDVLNPVEALRAVSHFDVWGKQEPEDGKLGRAVFVMNGLGPHIEQSLGTDARVYQQLLDMRPSLTTDSAFTHVVFNDGPNMVPGVAKELGAPFDMPLPTKRALEAVAFGSVVNTLFMQRPADAAERAPEEVSAKEIAEWRPIVGDTLKDSVIAGAIADGITLDAFKRFLPENKTFAQVAEQLVGFTTHQAKDLIGEAISRGVESDAKRIDFKFISERRFAMLKQNFNIQLIERDPNMPKPEGLEAVTDKLGRIKAVFDKGHLREKPILPPKVMLLAGVPGMGKSLVAKSAASILDKPLIKLDMARLFNKFVGESESNFARMFEVLESLQPCVVWVDEIEKALGGTAEGAVSTDGGVTDRVHGLFLTWLEEHKERILLIGTCNEPSKLSSALLSRTPLKYFVGYQDAEGLAAIWKSNLKALTDKNDLTDAQLGELVKMKPSLTGREVSQLVGEAREIALMRDDGEKGEIISFADLKDALKSYTSDYEKNPMRAQAILQMSTAYESASGRPIFDPSTGQALVVEERPEAQGAAGAGKGPAVRRPRAGEGMDGV